MRRVLRSARFGPLEKQQFLHCHLLMLIRVRDHPGRAELDYTTSVYVWVCSC